MTRVTYKDRLKYARATNLLPPWPKEDKGEPYSIVEASASPMNIDTPTDFKTPKYISPYILGLAAPTPAAPTPAAPTPADALSFTPHTAVRTRDGVQVISDSETSTTPASAFPLIHHRRHPVSETLQSFNQWQPPNPKITATARSLLELFNADEEHCRTAVIAGSGLPVTVEAARVRKMLLSARFRSAAMTCECFECGGAFLVEGGCFWKPETL
ncbi:uncharacterized protein H6S33_011037 [Morchella sextelata]|uniref:uncharacterized protein n=1 Tax=Morchella sextelata TaxID=1174677 RepID=UPI001D049412|nr:uncharacterized protein H6S33_011037 [Morchella sextelata]KAH0611772.1 hypothetical protein H6S33_011037 [Morchella sextelata]